MNVKTLKRDDPNSRKLLEKYSEDKGYYISNINGMLDSFEYRVNNPSKFWRELGRDIEDPESYIRVDEVVITIPDFEYLAYRDVNGWHKYGNKISDEEYKSMIAVFRRNKLKKIKGL